MLSVLLAGQDSIGLKTWGSYALTAGLSDLTAFDACMIDTTPVPLVDRGVRIARALGVNGTPAVAINGHLFASPPSLDRLYELLEAAARGQDPF